MIARSLLLFFGSACCLAVLLALGPRPGEAQTEPQETLIFVISGLRTDTGILRGGIYASAAVWTQPGHQVATCTARPRRGTARCTIRPPGPGRYAFAFYHDADGDRQLDRDFIGVPQEGYGFSNDARPGLGAPSFESAAFTVSAGGTYQARLLAQYGWHP